VNIIAVVHHRRHHHHHHHQQQQQQQQHISLNIFEPGFNDIGLSDSSSIASDFLWYQLIPHS
jgi:hypothetical protein